MSDIVCKVGERLRIGDHVVIKVIAVDGELIRLRVSAAEPLLLCRERPLPDQHDAEDFFHSE